MITNFIYGWLFCGFLAANYTVWEVKKDLRNFGTADISIPGGIVLSFILWPFLAALLIFDLFDYLHLNKIFQKLGKVLISPFFVGDFIYQKVHGSKADFKRADHDEELVHEFKEWPEGDNEYEYFDDKLPF